MQQFVRSHTFAAARQENAGLRSLAAFLDRGTDEGRASEEIEVMPKQDRQGGIIARRGSVNGLCLASFVKLCHVEPDCEERLRRHQLSRLMNARHAGHALLAAIQVSIESGV